jgi:GNAT superfamily N-acetyltransferase
MDRRESLVSISLPCHLFLADEGNDSGMKPVACRRVIARVTEDDLLELLPLMRAYCDFYEADPSDEDLLSLSRVLLGSPDCHGVQLIARDKAGSAVGFATVYWTWSTLRAREIGVMNDLFVAEEARGGGVAEALIAECLALCRDRGAVELGWQTAKDNLRAQAVYERVGGRREEWLDYSLQVSRQSAP